MEIEGRLDILRLDRPTDPQPWTYDVTYLPNRVSGWAKLHKCVGLESLVAYLGEVGILPEFIKRALGKYRSTDRLKSLLSG